MNRLFISIGLSLSLLCHFPAKCQFRNTPVDTLKVAPKWHQTKAFKTLAAPTILIGYGLSVTGTHGLPISSKEVYKARQQHFSDFHTGIDNVTWALPALTVYGLNAAGIKGKHGLIDRTFIYILSNAVANASVQTLKYATQELRPDGSSNNSFPSGHTTNAFVAAEFLHQEYKDQSPWYSIAGYSVAAGTGALRILNNRHWLSDVLAGAGIGMLSTKLVYLAYPWLQHHVGKGKKDKIGIVPMYNGRVTGIVMVWVIH